MDRATDSGHFFQTSESLASSERKAAKAKNKHGNPIKLPSKILSVCADPEDGNAVYVSEAAGEVKRVALDTNEVKALRPAIGTPLTSLAITSPGTTESQVYAGSWDKAIHPVSLPGGHPNNKPNSNSKHKAKLTGHSDFVKCLLSTTARDRPLLISGGADSMLIIWDVESGRAIGKLQHPGVPQAFAIDPLSSLDDDDEGDQQQQQDQNQAEGEVDSFVLFTASNRPEIHRWTISMSRTSTDDLKASIKPFSSSASTSSSDDSVIRDAHATSVYALHFDSTGDLWTASADKTASRLSREQNYKADTILRHPDFVRDVVVAESAGLVVTACRDEEVRVWDAASGDLVCVYTGHFEEVTGLALVGRLGREVVSVGIDGTVRRWSLDRGDMRRFVEEREREANGEVGGAGEVKRGLLTEEEEAELAELMDDDD